MSSSVSESKVKCPKCKQYKPVSDFHNLTYKPDDKRRVNNINLNCRACNGGSASFKASKRNYVVYDSDDDVFEFDDGDEDYVDEGDDAISSDDADVTGDEDISNDSADESVDSSIEAPVLKRSSVVSSTNFVTKSELLEFKINSRIDILTRIEAINRRLDEIDGRLTTRFEQIESRLDTLETVENDRKRRRLMRNLGE